MRPIQAFSLEALSLPSFHLPEWWHRLDENPDFQIYANYGLSAAYSLIALVALVQLIRIQVRVPEYGWTTQKVFHLLNALVCIVRAGIFFWSRQLENLQPPLVRTVLMDVPGLLFFTTYTLLVLFWAEIYHEARSMPAGSLRPAFIMLNVAVYAIQGGLWALSSYGGTEQMQQLGYLLSDAFLALVSLGAAVGFLLYGGRLFLMLQRFPIESRGRRKKLREVGLVTSICAGCFAFRALLVASAALDRQDFELDLATHPLVNVLYYAIVEILPSASVLYILRKLPPKSSSQNYQPIPSQ